MENQIYIKSEPVDEDDPVYCRSCFKLMTENVKDPETDSLFKWFEEIIQMPIRESKSASNFCFDCSVSIGSFIQFKKLAELKQKKFYEIMDGFSNDFSELFFIKLKADPLTVIIKEESNNMSLMRSEEFDDSSPEPRSSKRAIKYSLEATSSKQMTCPICTKNVYDVVEHLRMCNGKQCNKCSFKTVDTDEMEQHKREQHGSKKPKKEVDMSKRMQWDKIRIKNEGAASKKKLSFACDQCGNEFSNKGSIVAHVNRHIKDKPIKCTICPYSTNFIKYLRNHMTSKHNARKGSLNDMNVAKGTGPGRCHDCNKDYKNLKSHYDRIHGKVKNYQCQECGSEYYSRHDFLSHMQHRHKNRLTERELNKFICEICGKGFGRKQLYDLHQRTHLSLDFQCDLCDRKFAMKSRVAEHIKCSHLKIMDKECDVCGKRFFNTAKLNLHYNVHAGIKFHCFVDGCRASRSRRDAMVYHMKNDHKLCTSEREEYLEKLNAVWAQLKKR